MISIINKGDFDKIKNILPNTLMQNGELKVENITKEEMLILYKFFRRSFLDSTIPVKKPIGFYINNKSNGVGLEVISRNISVLESNIELIKNISKLIVIGDCADEIVAKDLVGKIKAGNLNVISDGSPVKFLDPSIEVLNSIESIDLGLVVYENTGSCLMDDNMEILQSIVNDLSRTTNNYYPLNTENTLYSNIRILPFNGFKIRYNLVGNISELDINYLWKNYINNLSEEVCSIEYDEEL